jgi:hypothetical protein
VRVYNARVYSSNDVQPELETSDDCIDCVRALGENAIDQFMSKNPRGSDSSIELVRKLVQLEIEHKPERVGPPIDVVRVDRNGAKWVQVSPSVTDCPKI